MPRQAKKTVQELAAQRERELHMLLIEYGYRACQQSKPLAQAIAECVVFQSQLKDKQS